MISEDTAMWIEHLSDLRNEQKAINKFEKEMASLVRASNAKLMKEINQALVKLKADTGFDWSSYFDDFDISEWEPGEFYELIEKYVIDKIQEGIKNRGEDV